MELRVFMGRVVGASLIQGPAPWPLEGYKNEEEAVRAAEEIARTKGQNGATVGLFAREDHAKCYAICGWEVLKEGKLRTLSGQLVEETLRVTAADFDNPTLGNVDIQHLVR